MRFDVSSVSGERERERINSKHIHRSPYYMCGEQPALKYLFPGDFTSSYHSTWLCKNMNGEICVLLLWKLRSKSSSTKYVAELVLFIRDNNN